MRSGFRIAVAFRGFLSPPPLFEQVWLRALPLAWRDMLAMQASQYDIATFTAKLFNKSLQLCSGKAVRDIASFIVWPECIAQQNI